MALADGLAVDDPRRVAWRRHALAWGALVVGLGLLFYRDVADLGRIWWDNSTFGHCLLIPPIIAWLAWQRREGLAQLTPRPWLPGAGLMFGAGVLWLLGEFAGVAVVRHAALVFLLQASVPTVFGLAVTRALLFPLFFALFMIPVGEQLVPYLQTITAKFCIVLLDLFGVPAYIDGVFIAIPNGNFEVAEACSGVRFLIAMAAFGTLVANICFKSWQRRVAFIIASIAVPIVANGIRAWGTIYIAHLTTPEFARGVDHVIYGWFFFAIVMAITIAAGWRFFDRSVDDPFFAPEALQRADTPPAPVGALAKVGLAALLLTAAAPAYAAFTAMRAPAQATAALQLPAPSGWSRATAQGIRWVPSYKGAAATAVQTYVDAAGQPVELYVAVFDRQSEKGELIGYGQGVAPPTAEGVMGWSWAGNRPAPAGAGGAQINYGSAVRDVWQYYWVNDRLVGSPYAAKIEGLKARLLGGSPQAATVVISAQRRDPLVSAAPALERFGNSLGPIDRLIADAIVPAAQE